MDRPAKKRSSTRRASSSSIARSLSTVSCSARIGAPASAQDPRPHEERVDPFPETEIGDLGRALLDAINGGERAQQEEFVRSSVSRAGLEEIGLDERVAYLRAIAQQSGGLDVCKSSGVDPLETIVVTHRGAHWARIYAFTDRLEPGKLREYGVVPIRDPALEAEAAWPRTKLEEAEVVRELERQLAGAVRRDEFSGVVLVAKGERVLFQKACGLADKGWKVENRVDTRFNLASMNKMFTAVAVAQLVQAGKLRFADHLSQILPDYPNAAAAGKITIEHLLTHTAGLGMLFDRPGFDRRKRYRTHADYFPVFAGAPFFFEPGTSSAYSNEGYVVLGAVIEKLTGQSYFERVKASVFAPCGMSDTDSFAIDEVVSNLATGYARFEDDPLGLGPWRPNWFFLQWKGCAASGGYSTAPDLLKFAQALRANRLVEPQLTAKVLEPHRVGGWYGYGFQVRAFGGKDTRGHGGGGPSSGINSELGWFVDGSYTVAVLGNYDMSATPFFEGLMEFLARQ